MDREATLGILGGSGVYDLAGLQDAREVVMNTPFGAPSDALVVGELDGVRAAFLPRHGRGHRLTPTEVPYRANLWALRRLGVQRVISASAVGSLREDCAPGDFVLVDQFVDRTVARPRSFFGEGAVVHVPLAEPVCAQTAAAVAAAAVGMPLRVHSGGTYVCIEGPQFSTLAESTMHRSLGFDVVGMTGATEARLAREAGMSYCSIAMVTDFDCWHPQHGDVDVAKILEVAGRNAIAARDCAGGRARRFAVAGHRARRIAELTRTDSHRDARQSRAAARPGRVSAHPRFAPAREGCGECEDRGSRFLAWAFRCPDEERLQARLAELRAEHPKARHHCWAWRAGARYRFTDDGEPGGTAGRPMLQALEGAGLDEAAVICVRYFGGVKLGTGGLVRAYSAAAARAVENAGRAPIVIRIQLPLFLPFARLGLRDEIASLFPGAVLRGDYEAEGWRGNLCFDSAEMARLEALLAERGID